MKCKHTLPKPAEVFCNPSARKPWKQAASTRAKMAMESQALKPEGNALPLEAAKATRRNPAGMRRNEETKKGPYFGISSFIATMEVPQKKNGDINTAPSHNSSTIVTDDSSLTLAFPSSSALKRHSFNGLSMLYVGWFVCEHSYCSTLFSCYNAS